MIWPASRRRAASGGVAVMAGREIVGPSLDRGVVFQGHALLPWLTAEQNVAFAVRSRHPEWTRQAVHAHARRFLDLVGLTRSSGKKPAELSGGMRQRVGIARAFSVEPKMLMMDEPFGALDALTRGVIQDELLKLCSDIGQTVFMITHDIDEAILLADRIFLMSNGPRARLAEIVVNPLPRTRTRTTLAGESGYYMVRNYLIDFLIRRSAMIQQEVEQGSAEFDAPRLVHLNHASEIAADLEQSRAARIA